MNKPLCQTMKNLRDSAIQGYKNDGLRFEDLNESQKTFYEITEESWSAIK